VNVNSTHDEVISLMNKGKASRGNMMEKQNFSKESSQKRISRKSHYSLNGNKRKSCIDTFSDFEHGHMVLPSTAYTSSTDKRQTYHTNSTKSQMKIQDQD
jgi:hypothetical protein